MSAADWADMANSLSTALVTRGATAGLTPPSGGGTFVYAFNAIASTEGAVALFVDLANFNPIAAAKGGQITGALKKGPGAATLYSAFLFMQARGADVNDNAYMIGFENNDPARIKVYKGPIIDGIPATDPASGGVTLMASDDSFNVGEWVHLRMDVIVEPSNDILIKCYSNDLTAHAVSAPSWVALPGCEEFIDDALGIASGSLPYDGGYAGKGFEVSQISRRAQVDYVTLYRQT